ncbi:MAG: hypothetical protein KDE26_09315 [Bacteroidetes bacterium]|nr:hypothetical protein [Bacteroidota bacterium]
MKNLYYLVLPILCWQMTLTLSLYSYPERTENHVVDSAVRIAIMPFCNESPPNTTHVKPDGQKLYNYTISKLKTINNCQKPVEWISKYRTGKTIASYISKVDDDSEVTSSCNYYLTNSVCEEISADIIVVGEYIVGADKTVEVYYSYENCEGIYTSEIKYLTSQPIVGNVDDMSGLYDIVGLAIKRDLENFLSCETNNVIPVSAGKIKRETPASLIEAKALYETGDNSTLNYLKSIELLEALAKVQPENQEVEYYLGLTYFAIEEYEKAAPHFQKIPDFEAAKEYAQFCQLQSRPAIWYNKPERRRAWWNNLNMQWKTAFNTQVLGMTAAATPTDEQLESIFAMTSLSLNDVFLPDLSGVKALTNLIQLSCEKNSLQNLEGVETLVNLGQLSINNNKIQNLKGVDQLPLLTRIYCRSNPMESLEGVEGMKSSRLVIFCAGSVKPKEMKRIKDLGIVVQP